MDGQAGKNSILECPISLNLIFVQLLNNSTSNMNGALLKEGD